MLKSIALFSAEVFLTAVDGSISNARVDEEQPRAGFLCRTPSTSARPRRLPHLNFYIKESFSSSATLFSSRPVSLPAVPLGAKGVRPGSWHRCTAGTNGPWQATKCSKRTAKPFSVCFPEHIGFHFNCRLMNNNSNKQFFQSDFMKTIKA